LSKAITVSCPGFSSLLTLLFIGLKLTGYITWSWWWVMSPLLISFGFVMAIFFTALLLYIVASQQD
jgi:hypothetical protein